jgi:Tfp pilus assembly protein PilO
MDMDFPTTPLGWPEIMMFLVALLVLSNMGWYFQWKDTKDKVAFYRKRWQAQCEQTLVEYKRAIADCKQTLHEDHEYEVMVAEAQQILDECKCRTKALT